MMRLTVGRWGDLTRKVAIRMTQSEPYSPWQLRAENCIKEVKHSLRQLMSHTHAPHCLWDYCMIYVSELRSVTAHPYYSLQGHTPYEIITGNTPDISEYLEFAWYESVWYNAQEVQFPMDQ